MAARSRLTALAAILTLAATGGIERRVGGTESGCWMSSANWTHVRKLLGYVRYDTDEALRAINDLYKGDLRLLQSRN